MGDSMKNSEKNYFTTFFLTLFLGAFGIHRFYVNKWGTALLSLLTAGGLGIWTTVDLVQIIRKKFTDATGNKILP